MFIVFTTLYLFYNGVTNPDIWLIFVSLLVLIFTICVGKKQAYVEGFANNGLLLSSDVVTINDILTKFRKVDVNEDITNIAAGMMFYTTVFNSTSYPNFGKSWINISPQINNTPQQSTKKCTTTEPNNLSFEINPVFTRKSGFFLGNNRLVGPLCNNLGIHFHNTFTVVMVAKHGNLLINNSNHEIELLKFYANSPNNNGFALYIEDSSVIVENNIQLGSLVFQYADMAPRTCLISQDDSFMHLDNDVLTFYFIVKGVDNIKIISMSEKSNTINNILQFNITTDDITFSNKEMVINRLTTWQANIYNFALYNFALSDDDVSSFYNHIMAEFVKNNDPSFNQVASDYNKTLDALADLNKCPYNSGTCDACQSVTSWCDPSQIALAPVTCKQSINTFCSSNTNNDLCKCWNKNTSAYATDACKLYRTIFSGSKDTILHELSVNDLETVKNKYKLVDVNDCPKKLETKSDEWLKNNYMGYDYNKLKVHADDIDVIPHHPKTSTVVSGISKNVTAQPRQQITNTDPNLEKIMVKNTIKELPPDQRVDLFMKDPNIDVSESKQMALLKEKDLQDAARREENRTFRIGQVERPATKNEHDDTPDAIDNNIIGSAQPDTFFNKFLKMMIPA